MNDPIAIKVKGIYKSFKLPHEKHAGLKQALINFRPSKKYEMQHVLQRINFEVKKGEFFGIVGRNGSGKSTLLKILAQIYTPDEGSISVNGSLTPFIELGVGFNPELTGRENVYLNGALLGFDRRQVGQMYDGIVEFAELSKFMDQKLKNYSSGMQVRLAFSIAIRAESSILIIDEVLAVGDAAFQQKCFKYFETLKEQKKTIVLVSHDMGAIKQFCSRALLLEKGEIYAIGDPEEIALKYESLNYEDMVAISDDVTTSKKVATLEADGKPSMSFTYGKDIIFETVWADHLKVGIIGFAVFRGTECVFATNSINQKVTIKNNRARLTINGKLGAGRYRVLVGLFGKSRHDSLGGQASAEFLVYGHPSLGDHKDEWEGISYLENKWE